MSGILLTMVASASFPAIGLMLVALCAAAVVAMFAGTTILVGELLAIIGTAVAPTAVTARRARVAG